MLTLNIFSPEKKVLEGRQVLEVTLPGSEGQIQILPGHAAMVGTLETGIMSYLVSGEGQARAAISTGFFEVADDRVTMTVETVEMSGEVDLERARRAQQKAEKMLQDATLEPQQFRKYELKLQRAIIRQQTVAGS
ncbi:MAG: ATP synthase F1 subunit epsilon [Bdellovibrionales bacterium]|nr:ATP synthase F1 subunit epsilon [Bdellovibrionales bacterium]